MSATPTDKFDVTKLEPTDLFHVAKMAWLGTPSFKFIGSVAACVILIYSASSFINKWLSPTDTQSVKWKDDYEKEVVIRQNFELQIKAKDEEIIKLKTMADDPKHIEKLNKYEKEILELNQKIDKKPSYSTCSDYNKEMRLLRDKLEKKETLVQWLANPQQTPEMIKLNLGFTPEQVSAYAAMATANRPDLDRLIRQIELLEITRRPCD